MPPCRKLPCTHEHGASTCGRLRTGSSSKVLDAEERDLCLLPGSIRRKHRAGVCICAMPARGARLDITPVYHGTLVCGVASDSKRKAVLCCARCAEEGAREQRLLVQFMQSHRTHLSPMPSCASKAHSDRQKPSLGCTMDRRCTQCVRALAAFQAKRRIRYAIVRAAERETPAPQCTSVAAATELHIMASAHYHHLVTRASAAWKSRLRRVCQCPMAQQCWAQNCWQHEEVTTHHGPQRAPPR